MTRRMHSVLLTGLSAVALVCAVGCTEGPPTVTRAWVSAAVRGDGEQALARTCNDKLWLVDVINGAHLGATALGVLGAPRSVTDVLRGDSRIMWTLGSEVVKVDVSALRYELESSSDLAATVRVHGRVGLGVRSQPFAFPVDVLYVVTREDEDSPWSWCGAAP